MAYQASVWICGAAILFLASCSPAPQPVADSTEPPLHLYLLAGQSNMAGRGDVEELDRTPLPNIFALDANMVWGPAKEPLHFDKPDLLAWPRLCLRTSHGRS
jgi:hypothetical protein